MTEAQITDYLKELNEADYQLAANTASILLQRLRAGGQGYQFNQERDLYKVLGYKLEPQFQDFLNEFLRADIASRIITLHPKYTWKRRPILIDGDRRSDETEEKTAFLTQWEDLENRLKLTHYFQRLDRLARIGQYAILLLGVSDSSNLEAPIGRVRGPDSIIFVKPVSENNAQISELETDASIAQFGKPKFYKVELGLEGLSTTAAMQTPSVHFSRVIHVVEDPLDNDVLGRPVLEKVLNRLFDLAKVVGGGSEAFWLNIRRGTALLAREGQSLPVKGTEQYREMKSQLDEYAHGLRRILTLMGVDIEELGADIVDPTGLFNVLISLLSAASDIPQRILIGSERGNLASEQDADNWAAIVRDRQLNFAEPFILRAFIDRCIEIGVLAAPTSGSYQVEWPNITELSDVAKAERAEKIANALLRYMQAVALGGDLILPPGVFSERYLEHIMEADIEDLLEREAERLREFEEQEEPEEPELEVVT